MKEVAYTLSQNSYPAIARKIWAVCLQVHGEQKLSTRNKDLLFQNLPWLENGELSFSIAPPCSLSRSSGQISSTLHAILRDAAMKITFLSQVSWKGPMVSGRIAFLAMELPQESCMFVWWEPVQTWESQAIRAEPYFIAKMSRWHMLFTSFLPYDILVHFT